MLARIPREGRRGASFDPGALGGQADIQSFHHVYSGANQLRSSSMPRDVGAMLAGSETIRPGGRRRLRELIAANDLHPWNAANDLSSAFAPRVTRSS